MVSSTVARSRAVTASSRPTDQPPAERPVSLAAPRMVVLRGTSWKVPLEDGSPCGGRPMRREYKYSGRSLKWITPPPLPPKSKICVPSMKNGRCSGRNCSKAVRFTNVSSTSTCPKSGFTVASSVGLDLDVFAGLEAREPDQAGEAGGHAALGPGHERKERQLVLALNPADEAHAPYLRLGPGEAQLCERNADFGRPAE